ncbi:MAG: hypothetical protein R2911_14030 [Caldilineaceae bacterium]
MTVKNMSTPMSAAEGGANSSAATPDRGQFLRRVLQGNAAFSTLSGMLFVLDSQPVANFLGFTNPAAATYVLWLGISLLGWALFAYWVSTRPTLSRTAVFSVLAGDLLWVAGSIILLIRGWLPFSTAGYWAVAIVADMVALFAILQFVGWRRSSKG